MQLDSGLRHGFRFGDIAIDPGLHQIRHHHEVTRMSEQATELLLMLAEAPGEIIPFWRIAERLCTPDFAELAGFLRELQRALGDSPESPHFVRQVGLDGFQLLVNATLDTPPVPTTKQILSGGGNPN